jgi:hypothetical protein
MTFFRGDLDVEYGRPEISMAFPGERDLRNFPVPARGIALRHRCAASPRSIAAQHRRLPRD